MSLPRPNSHQINDGPARAPHRSFHRAMGLTEADFSKPFIGVANTWNEVTPCNITLHDQAEAIKASITASGAVPREFTAISVSDGIAMGRPLLRCAGRPSRLRQKPPGHDDGHDSPERAERVFIRR
jgi:dihydroxyacid dehydratase/phosphogluconate dehydratase